MPHRILPGQRLLPAFGMTTPVCALPLSRAQAICVHVPADLEILNLRTILARNFFLSITLAKIRSIEQNHDQNYFEFSKCVIILKSHKILNLVKVYFVFFSLISLVRVFFIVIGFKKKCKFNVGHLHS